MATTVTIQEAKAQLTELIRLAEQGEEIFIAQDDQPKVKLVPVPPKKIGKPSILANRQNRYSTLDRPAPTR